MALMKLLLLISNWISSGQGFTEEGFVDHREKGLGIWSTSQTRLWGFLSSLDNKIRAQSKMHMT